MSTRLTILCENSIDRVSPFGLTGEHGFACHLSTPAGDFLFDTGGGLTLTNNTERLGIDLSSLQGICLSHGHFDHTGGLKQVLEMTGPIPIYAHPDIFSERYSHNGQSSRDIGLPWPRTELEALGAQFKLDAGPQPLTPEILLSGEVPRNNKEETGDPSLVVLTKNKDHTADPLNDDLSLYLTTEKGLVILLGCAHAGLMNIIDHALDITGQDRVHMILGGTHLKFCSDAQMDATLTRLKELDIDKIGASHCTGLRGARILAETFGEKFFSASVGVELDI